MEIPKENSEKNQAAKVHGILERANRDSVCICTTLIQSLQDQIHILVALFKENANKNSLDANWLCYGTIRPIVSSVRELYANMLYVTNEEHFKRIAGSLESFHSTLDNLLGKQSSTVARLAYAELNIIRSWEFHCQNREENRKISLDRAEIALCDIHKHIFHDKKDYMLPIVAATIDYINERSTKNLTKPQKRLLTSTFRLLIQIWKKKDIIQWDRERSPIDDCISVLGKKHIILFVNSSFPRLYAGTQTTQSRPKDAAIG